MKPRDVRYAWNGGAALAYEVFGAGPVDLLYLQGYASHIDLNWQSPHLARFLRGLGQMARVIHADRRGWGCSERFSPGDVAPLEVQADDLIAVMEAAGSERAVLVASLDTCTAGVLFAATYPDRTAGLVLIDPMLSWYDDERSHDQWTHINDRVRREWGTSAYFGEDWRDLRERDEWFAPWARASVAPGALAVESDAFGSVDVRGLLASIHCPTLVVGAEEGRDSIGDLLMGDARAANAGIADSTLIEPALAGGASWHHWYARGPAILTSVDELIQGIREEEAVLNRVLATVLFTDIVSSTQTSAALGDHRWAELVERHHATVRALLARYRGHEVDTAGDGFFATFDGPARAVKCAAALVEAVKPLGLQIRAGVHTGELETIAGKAGGMAVVIGARIGALAGPSEVLTSQTVKDLTAGSGIAFQDAGEHELKGVPETWRVYRVAPTIAS